MRSGPWSKKESASPVVLLGLWGLMVLAPLLPMAVKAGGGEDLLVLLEKRSCPGCRLQDADLVQADLRDVNLQGARLQRANLSGARLDGAQLSGADLSFTSLNGASLRGADLRGATLEGTDLRRSDLSGARLDVGSLTRSYWQRAQGLDPALLGYADLHNAGVEAAAAGRYPEAERLFGEALNLQPDAAISWVARGLSRAEQGNNHLAARDLTYAATLYQRGGDEAEAQRVRKAALALGAPSKGEKGGNGLGSALLTGAVGLAQFLAPLAAKALVPVGL